LQELCRQETSRYTRPLVLMMQNGWVGEALRQTVTQYNVTGLPAPNGQPMPRLNLSGYIRRTAADLAGIFPQTSLKREWRWLKTRLVNR